MKRAATILAVVTALSANADLTIQVTPGSLDSHAADLSSATGKVILKGNLKAIDFMPLAILTEDVTLLDMSDVRIEGTSTRLPDAGGHRVSQADRVPDHAFFQCRVREIILPQACELGDAAFAEAKTRKVTLPKGMVRIPDHAFYKSAVEEISNAEAVRWIGKEAFAGSCVETLAFPALVQTGDFAMAGMPCLTEVTMPGTVRLGKGALMDCPKLTRINGGVRLVPDYFIANSAKAGLPEAPAAIGEYAFANTEAESLLLASGFSVIAEGACMGMTSLRQIYATQCGSHVPDADPDAFRGLDVPAIKLHVFPGTAESWRKHEVWGAFDIIESLDSVDEIASDAQGLTITVANGIVEIESETPVSAIDVFSQSGFKTLHASPSTTHYSFPVSDIKVKGAVIVRVTNAVGDKVVKIMI